MEEDKANEQVGSPSGWSKLIAFLIILGICFFIGNVVLILLALMGGLPLTEGIDVFAAISDPEMRPYIKAGVGLNHLILFTGTSVLFAFWLKRKKWIDYFDHNDIDFGLLSSCVLLLMVAYPIITASATVFNNVEWAQQFDDSNIEDLMNMLQMDHVGDLVVNLIIVALLPAIGEELLFRGIIQKELVARISNHHVAIIIASVIFSAVHLQIQGFLPKFFIGLIMGYTYYWTKSIWYPMIIHFINNGLQTVLLFLVGDQIEGMEEEAIQPEISILLIGVIISCFLCVLIVLNIKKQLDHKQTISMLENTNHGE